MGRENQRPSLGGKMKVILFLIISVMMSPLHAGSVGSDCKIKGKKMSGKVQIVSSFADFKVQIVNSFPDLKVQQVTSFPNDCGKWQIVESFPDFKIQIVNSFPDFKIQYVNSFPGVP